MHRLLAFIRRDALVAASYRTGMIFSLGSLIFLIVPVYFVTKAIQPLIEDSIRGEGGQYFAFVVAGLATFQFVTTAVNAFPNAIATGIRTGTLEIVLSTPTRLPTLLFGFTAYPFLWTTIRAAVMVLAGALLGARFGLDRMIIGAVICVAITLSYLPFGMLAAALLLVTRTTGPLPTVVLTVSMFLGGVYYPTHVIPSWLQSVSDIVPLTYGLRALRRTVIQESQPGSVLGDLMILGILTGLLFILGSIALLSALRYARRTGTLAQY